MQIYFLKNGSNNESSSNKDFNGSKKIVYNKKRLRLGIISGRFNITLKENGNIKEIETKYGLKTILKNRNIYYLKSINKKSNDQNLISKIEGEPLIEKVNLEIVEDFESTK